MELRFYEGYIRNRKRLCEELQIENIGDRNAIERKILLKGYLVWGHDLVKHLYGSFAFVIRDEENDEIFCARDPFGIQSFFYYETSSGELLYSVDINQIVNRSEYKKKIDPEALRLYMMFGYPVGEKTLFNGIKKLLPGHILVSQNGKKYIERYYKISFSPDRTISEDEWTRCIEQTIDEVLEEDRDNYDITQCGLFLSGGVDSSYLLAMSGVKKTYCIAFDEKLISEDSQAREAAEKLGADLVDLRISQDEYFSGIPEVIKNAGLPMADPSSVAFYLGCESLVKEYTDAEKRAFFSGEGVDEFFAGYYVHRLVDKLGAIDGPGYYGCDGVLDSSNAGKILGHVNDYSCEWLLDNRIEKDTDEYKEMEPLNRMLAADIMLWLEGNIFFGLSTPAHASGLTILTPYSDQRVFELSASIPSKLKHTGECSKYIFRKSAEKKLPEEIAFRPKAGFPVPVKEWMRNKERSKAVSDTLFGETSRLFFDQEFLRTYWEDFLRGSITAFRVVYAVYVFVIWYEEVYQKI